MTSLTSAELRQAVRGGWVSPHSELGIRGVSIDSRTAGAGEVFFAIRGERFDGHQFVPAAAEAGCLAAVIEADCVEETLARLPEPGRALPAGILAVDDTTLALGRLAGWRRQRLGGEVVGVTGSNGKTTVKRMIDHVLGKSRRGTCSPKSFNNAIGVPLTILSAELGDDYVVCEIGTNAPGEVESLTRIARPKVGVITSIGPSHLAGLGGIEGVAREKASILEHVQPAGLGVVPAGCDLLEAVLRNYRRVRLVRFGEDSAADLRLTDYAARAGGSEFHVNGHTRVRLPLPGRHNAANALAALAVAQRLGVPLERAADALADFPGVKMRLERIERGGATILNDAYNANPASLAAAVEVLVETPADRRILVAGDMLELGDEATDLHRTAGRGAAERGVDVVVGVGKLGRSIARGASEAGADAREAEDAAAAGTLLAGLLSPGDVVLIKGSRGARMERVVEALDARDAPAEAEGPPA